MRVEVTRTLKRIVKIRVENEAVRVTANVFLSNKKLRQIIYENIDWINSRKSAAAVQAQPNTATVPQASHRSSEPEMRDPSDDGRIVKALVQGEKTLILGDIVKVMPGSSAKSYLDGDVLYIPEKHCSAREARIGAINSYLKKIAAMYVSDEIANFGSDVSLCPVKIEFRDNNDFWVKCSLASQRILCFDFRIVQLPQRLRRYVIAHAFAHFTHPLHDDDFWNFMSNALPQYKECAKELERYRLLRDI